MDESEKKKMYSIKLAWKTKLLYLPLLLKIWYIIIEFVNLNNLRGISEKKQGGLRCTVWKEYNDTNGNPVI
jgi:hypothetical protein